MCWEIFHHASGQTCSYPEVIAGCNFFSPDGDLAAGRKAGALHGPKQVERSHVTLQIGCLFLWEHFLCVRQIKPLACLRTRRFCFEDRGEFQPSLETQLNSFYVFASALFPILSVFSFEKKSKDGIKVFTQHILCSVSLLYCYSLNCFSTFFYSVVVKTMAKEFLLLLTTEDQVLLEEHLLRLLDWLCLSRRIF